MDEMIKEFKKQYPSKEVIGESSGTLLAIRKITELKKEADILFAADAESIKNMLIPQYADWYLTFYRDRVVLAYTERSKYTNEINAQNWYKILLRKDVRFGYANPDQAPIGYRTLMCWQLADFYYKDKINNNSIYNSLKEACPNENIMPDVAEMLHVLESLSLDYAFVYESTAKQHNLKYIRLPKEIDLGSLELVDIYKKAKVEVVSGRSGKKETMVGSPIAFALTILRNTPNYKDALEFTKLFLGPTGREIMFSNDQEMMIQPVPSERNKIPAELRLFLSE
jgi:molybdate/tungstate transport system substrate-binding protein